MTRLSALHPSDTARIAYIGDDPENTSAASALADVHDRLIEMGFVEGAEVRVLHEAPFGGDPMAVMVNNVRIALRRREADAVHVVLDEN